ncbi:hypothetical protein SEA_TRAX_135 [Gordonia phage Trax]|uniref:Uncharacterized protein n=1 Tax=Gordonia phage Trax TaxID=2591121 RepID=A0A515MH61_9CAUD|nr:hypothetical protein L3Y20_gp097 [Gordonia phage Trax]QDM56015.1 hypothetical protein SEA_TRAX_135 [Gordonia phage Trax]
MSNKAMNVTVGTGCAVHAQYKGATMCGAEGRGPRSSRLTAVAAAVTCKRCIKSVGERAAVPAPQEATQEAETLTIGARVDVRGEGPQGTTAQGTVTYTDEGNVSVVLDNGAHVHMMRSDVTNNEAETRQEATAAAKGMIPKAQRVSRQEAAQAFQDGATIVVAERNEGDTLVVGEMTTTHSVNDTTWNELTAQVDMWDGRYPSQAFYALRNTGRGNDGVARVYLVETIKHGDTHTVGRVEITDTGLTWSAVNSLVGKSPYYATPLEVRDRTVRDVWAQFKSDAPRVTHGWADYSVEIIEPMALDEAAQRRACSHAMTERSSTGRKCSSCGVAMIPGRSLIDAFTAGYERGVWEIEPDGNPAPPEFDQWISSQ